MTREVCRLFLRGRCFYKKRCRYLHSRKELDTEAIGTVDRTVSSSDPET